MSYTININDIETTLRNLGGKARAKDIQDEILKTYCSGNIPENYKDEHTFRSTVQRRIEDHCPEAAGYDSSRFEAKLKRVGHGIYSLLEDRFAQEFNAIEEVSEPKKLCEGATKKISVNAYERDPKARNECIEYYGLKCSICDFEFEQTYGEHGKGFIHVHHLIPLSKIQKEYTVDSINDLRPVCPNCHAMIHRTDPPTSIEELREILKVRFNNVIDK